MRCSWNRRTGKELMAGEDTGSRTLLMRLIQRRCVDKQAEEDHRRKNTEQQKAKNPETQYSYYFSDLQNKTG